jgi:hypothetical protein
VNTDVLRRWQDGNFYPTRFEDHRHPYGLDFMPRGMTRRGHDRSLAPDVKIAR